MLKSFNPNSNVKNRALQAWMILIGCAKRRETITYKLLSIDMFGHEAAGVLNDILGTIATYCDMNNLPQLNVLVVNSETGLPGGSIPLDSNSIGPVTEKVFSFWWFNIVPPEF